MDINAIKRQLKALRFPLTNSALRHHKTYLLPELLQVINIVKGGERTREKMTIKIRNMTLEFLKLYEEHGTVKERLQNQYNTNVISFLQ